MLGRNGSKVIISVGVLYLILGAIMFPSWYFSVLTNGGVYGLLYEMQTTYLVWNLLALAVAVSLAITLNHIEKNHTSTFSTLQLIYKNKFTIGIFWLLLIAAVFRVVIVSFQQNNQNFEELSKLVSTIKYSQDGLNPVEAPIEVVYANEKSLNNLFSQIQPELKLIESEVSDKNSSSAEGGVNIKEIFNLNAQNEQSSENKDKFAARELSTSEKVIKLINTLSQTKKLNVAKPINIESKEWGKVEEAIRVFDAYDIKFDQEDTELVKQKLTDEALRSRVSGTYSDNSWILLNGDIEVKVSGDFVNFNYEYVPSNIGGISFTCDIASSDIDKNELNMLRKENLWNISIFGQIIHKSQNDMMIYRMKCLSVFR